MDLDYAKPIMAITIFKESEHGQLYFEKNRIENGEITDKAPLPLDELKIVEAIIKDDKDFAINSTGLFPKNIVYIQQQYKDVELVWFQPRCKRPLFFTSDVKEFVSGDIYNCPNILYHVKDSRLSVYAFTGAFTEKSKLYHYPLGNISEKVCLGNASNKLFKGKSLEAFMEHWERLFWNTRFTYTDFDKWKIKIWKNNTVTDKQLIETKKISYTSIKHLLRIK